MNTTESNNKNLSTSQSFKAACLECSQKIAAQIERAKNNIVAEFRETFTAHEQLLNHMINQADALAWQTDYPHLLFPELAAEKIHAAAQWQARQQFLRRETSAYPLAA